MPSFSVYVNAFSLLPFVSWLPVNSYVAPSPSTQPVSTVRPFAFLPSTSSFVSATPSYSFSASPLVSVTGRFVISSVPSVVLTVNCAVTSLPAASFTTAVPLIAFGTLHTFTLLGSLVVSPSTV